MRRVATSLAGVPIAAVMCIACLATPATAHLANQTQIPNGANVYRLGTHWPAVGHVDTAGSDVLNSFGIAFAAAGGLWTRELCEADTDGDGYSNGAELGDPTCTWTPGAAPTRTTDITHPGFTDSWPSDHGLVFRLEGPRENPELAGPMPTEGILITRLHPKPWGTVNFGYTSTAWAQHYCNLTGMLEPLYYPKAWPLASREDAYGERRYLPDGQYVAISDVLGCAGSTYDTCAYSYSDPWSPQNTTKAETHSLYVDCRYRKVGELPYPPVRLISPDPGRGYAESLVEGVWKPIRVLRPSGAPDYRPFVCTNWMKYPAAEYSPRASGSVYQKLGADFYTCNPWTVNVLQCRNVTQTVSTNIPNIMCRPALPNLAPFQAGPVRYVLVFAIEHADTSGAIVTESDFVTLVATAKGIPEAEVNVSRWNHNETQELTHGTVKIDPTTANPNAIVSSLTLSLSTLKFKSSRIETVPEPDLPQDFPPELWIDGVSPDEGVVKVRYPGGPWGLLHWDATPEIAADVCRRGGQLDEERIPKVTTIGEESTSLTSAYLPAGNYVMISNRGACQTEKNLSRCEYIYNDPTYDRSVGASYTQALYVRCRWSALPKVRMSSAFRCAGYPEFMPDGDTNWHIGQSTFDAPTICAMANCSCANPADCKATSFRDYMKISRTFNWCNLSEIHTCTVVSDDMTSFSNAVRSRYECGVNNTYPSNGGPLRGDVLRAIDAQIKYGTTKAEFEAALKVQWPQLNNPAYDPLMTIEYFRWEADDDRKLQWVSFTIHNDNPSKPITRLYFQYVLDLIGLMPEIAAPQSLTARESTFTLSPRWIPSPYARGPLEWRLNGTVPGEGWLQARWPGGEWGFVNSRFTSTTRHQYHAQYFCNHTGNHYPGKYKRYDIASRMSTTRYKEAYKTYSNEAYISVWDFGCGSTDPNWIYDDDGLNKHCRYITNLRNETWAVKEAMKLAMYVQCNLEPKFRLAGVVPGSGIPQYFDKDINKWYGFYVYHSTPQPGDLERICLNYFGLHPLAGHTVTLSGYIPNSPSWPVGLWDGRCPYAGAPPEECSMYWRYATYGDGRNLYCHPPSSNVFPTGTIKRTLTAAIDTRDGIQNRTQFIELAASIAGTDVSNVIVPSWNEQFMAANEQVYVSLQLDDPGINMGVAMANIMADARFQWIAREERAVPVPNEIPETQWDWTFEVPNPDLPYRGFVWMRPTRHYSFGVACPPRWTVENSRTFCATIFGASALTWTLPPEAESFNLNGHREVFIKEVLCAAGASDIKSCSYFFASTALPECNGTQTIYLNCRPDTDTMTLTHSQSVSETATPSVSRSRSLTLTSSLSLSTSRTVSVSVSASTSLPPTASTSLSLTVTTTASMSPPPTGTFTPSATTTVTVTVSPPPTRTETFSATHAATVTPTHSDSQSRSYTSLTRSHSVSRSIDLPTPAPPTPVPNTTMAPPPTPQPTAPTPQPTPAPPIPTRTLSTTPTRPTHTLSAREVLTPAPPPAPEARVQITLRYAASDDAAAPLRPGAAVQLNVLATLAHMPPVRADSTATNNVLLTVALPAVFESIGCPAGVPGTPPPMPGGCRVAGNEITCADTLRPNVTEYRRFLSLWVARRVPYASADGAAAAIGATLRLTDWSAFDIDNADAAARAVPWTSESATVDLAVADQPFDIAVAVPAFDRVVLGTVIDLEGTGLQRLPQVVPFGPWMARVAVNDAGTRATVHVPPRLDASAIDGSDVRGELLTEYAGSSAPSMRFLLCQTIDTATVTAIAEGLQWSRSAAAGADATALLRRFAVDWLNAQATLRPLGTPNATVPVYGARVLQPENGSNPMVALPIFVPGIRDVGPGATAALVDGTQSVRIDRQLPYFDPVTGARVGTWVTFVFPESNATAAVGYGVAPGASGGVTLRPAAEMRLAVNATVYDPLAHVTTADARVVLLPLLQLELWPAGRHRLGAALTVAQGLRVTRPQVTAFPDAARSHRVYPIRSPDATCDYDATNVSTLCRTPELISPQQQRRQASSNNDDTQQQQLLPYRWTFELFADAPHYYAQDVAAWLHVRSEDAEWFALRVTFTADDRGANGSNGTGAMGDVSVGGPESTDGNATRPPASTAPPVTSYADTTPAPASFGAAVARGVFGFSAGCDGTDINFVAATLVAYVVLLAARVAWTAYRRRQTPVSTPAPADGVEDEDPKPTTSSEADSHVTTGVAPLRAMLRANIYGGAVWPCHHYCGPLHTTTLLVHALVLYASAATLVNTYTSVVVGDSAEPSGFLALGALTAAVAGLVQPIFALPFTMYRLLDDRKPESAPVAGYQPQDLSEVRGVVHARRGIVGVSLSTQNAIHAIDDFDEVPKARHTADEQLFVDDVFPEFNFGLGPDFAQTVSDFYATTTSEESNDSGTAQTQHSEQAADHPATTPTDLLEPSTPTAAESDPPRLDRHALRNEGVVVDSRNFTLGGYAACAVAAIVLIIRVATATAPWCAAEMSAFRDVMLVGLAADVAVVQPLYMALAHVWRWVSQDHDEDDESDTDSSGDDASNEGAREENAERRSRRTNNCGIGSCTDVKHELHPIHGQWRHVGPLADPANDV